MGVTTKEFKELSKRLKMAAGTSDATMVRATREIAETLKDTAKMRTPVSAPKTINNSFYEPYTAGGKRLGGSLRKAWDEDNKNIIVHKLGDTYFTAIHNNNYYASYVEDGHSQNVGQRFPVYKDGKLVMIPHKQAWVKGQHFLALSEEEVSRKASRILERITIQQCKEVFK